MSWRSLPQVSTGAVAVDRPARETNPASAWLRVLAQRAGPRRHPRWWALGFFLTLSLATLAWRMLPDPSVGCACQGNDPPTYVWALAWWPHALLHGLNPFYSYHVWYPVGANVARAASIPTMAFALWPITALFSPLVSYNVMTIASPTLAAFTAYLLCRRIVGRELPALAGGYLFGFGAYEFPQLVGHPNISLVFLVPLIALLALRRVNREISARRYIVLLALLLALQLGISTEVLATTVLMGFALLLAATILAPRPVRDRIDTLVAETVAAGLIAIVVCSPFLYYALLKGGIPTETIADDYGLDLLNPVLPTITTAIGGTALHGLTVKFEVAAFAEANGYLSLPIIAAFVIWALTTRRRLLARLLLIAALLALLASLGAHLHVAGSESIPLPYALIKNLPIIRQLTPSRIAMYTSLAVSIGVAAWLAEAQQGSRAQRVRWLVVGLGALMVFPNLGGELWSGPPPPPAFFRTATYRHYLTPGEVVLALPYAQNGTTMGWQGECGFCFKMPEGYLGHSGPEAVTGLKIANELGANHEVQPSLLLSFIRQDDIRDIVVDDSPRTPSPYEYEFDRLGMHGVVVGGVTVYHLPASGL